MSTKTNAVRLVQQAKIPCREAFYDYDVNDLNGNHAAVAIGFPPQQVYKTLVAKGNRTGIVVFCIPVCCELDLKKAAKVSGNKDVAMLPVKDLLGITGYIRGGCSPVGMKKKFPTWFDDAVTEQEKITVSAGVRGCQLLLSAEEILRFTGAKIADLTVR